MNVAIISKLISESLLSLYPVFVKKINLSIDLQMFTRLITYMMISLFLINYSFVTKTLLSWQGLALAFVNLIHIYASYEGFINLESGVSFTIFNIYPVLILLFSGVMWNQSYLLGLLGLIIFVIGNYFQIIKSNISENYKYQEEKNFLFGFIMIILAAITEALLYFIIKIIPTQNSWNHIFIAYFLGSIFITWYVFIFKNYSLHSTSSNNFVTVGIALLINAIIGLVGYYLRFKSAYILDPGIYSLLSFFGIVMAWIYGYIFNNEEITFYKIIATCLIIVSNYLVIKS